MPNWQSHIHAVLRHPIEPRILLLPGDNGWHLPYVLHPDEVWSAKVDVVNQIMGELLNTDVWTLRQIHYVTHEDEKTIQAIFEIILLDHDWQPPDGARWVNAKEVAGVQITNNDHAPILSAYLTALAQGTIPNQRPAWARPGWTHEVREWITAEITKHGYTLQKLEQLKQWGISSVLRAKTDGRDVYFKTTNPHMPLFVNEASVTKSLSELFPDYIPAPLSVDIPHDWMLLAEFDELFKKESPLETKVEAFRRFAHLQIETIGKAEALLSAGCLDRRIDKMIAQVDPLLADSAILHKLTPEQTAELRAFAPTIKDLCQQLAAFNLPYTLVHGDLHLGNAAIVNGQTIFFDWTDACLAHPFIDLHSLAWLENETDRETRLTAYLEPWTAFAPIDRLREIWRLAYVLIPLHHAVSYQYILNNLEPDSKPELDFAHEFLEQLLVRVKEFLEVKK